MMEMCRVVVPQLSCPVTGVFTRVVCTPRPWNETAAVGVHIFRGRRGTTSVYISMASNRISRLPKWRGRETLTEMNMSRLSWFESNYSHICRNSGSESRTHSGPLYRFYDCEYGRCTREQA
jgi:hypothetical protein